MNLRLGLIFIVVFVLVVAILVRLGSKRGSGGN
jgi:preprotein translocase subunit SecG